MDYLNWRLYFVVGIIIAWSCYIIYRSKSNKEILKYWGFRLDNSMAVLKKVLPFGLVSLIVIFFIGLYRNTLNITWHIIPLLILYPLWGVIQQFLLIALTAGNLQDFKNLKLNRRIIILFAAILFASVHYPYLWLIVGTFILALFYGWVYLKERNLFILGCFHGWLGTLFFYTVVNRDPFLEMFGRFF